MCIPVKGPHSQFANFQYIVVANPFPVRTQKLWVLNKRRVVLRQRHSSYDAAALRHPLSCFLLASPLLGLSSLSYSPLGFVPPESLSSKWFCQDAGTCHVPRPCIAAWPLPTPDALAEPAQVQLRIPQPGFSPVQPKTTSKYWRLVYVAHAPSTPWTSDRIRGLLVCVTNAAGLLPEASVEKRKPLSWHVPLPTVSEFGWLAQSLSQIGGLVCRVETLCGKATASV